ncbi:hypothetical protein HK102_005634 [Quaeritorhiza haematococci]|nr:hypothetical protein HK102_005634 [Quaeritorhiza haematococci]
MGCNCFQSQDGGKLIVLVALVLVSVAVSLAIVVGIVEHYALNVEPAKFVRNTTYTNVWSKSYPTHPIPASAASIPNNNNVNWKSNAFNGEALVLGADGRKMYLGLMDGRVQERDVHTNTPVRDFFHAYKGGPVWAVQVGANGDRLYTGGSDNLIRAWDLKSGSEVKRYEGHEGAVLSLAVTNDESVLYSLGADQMLRVWNVSSGEEMRSKGVAGHRMVVSADDKYIYSDAAIGTQIQFKATDASTLYESSTAQISGLDVTALAAHPNATSGGWFLGWSDGKIQEYAKLSLTNTTSTPSSVLKTYTSASPSPVSAMVVSFDGSLLYVGLADGTISEWSTANQTRLRTFTGHSGAVTVLVLGPDGRLISGSADSIRGWDLSNM